VDQVIAWGAAISAPGASYAGAWRRPCATRLGSAKRLAGGGLETGKAQRGVVERHTVIVSRASTQASDSGTVQSPDILVYLIHWNRPLWCGSAVASILASRGITLELTVVDNGQLAGPPLESLLPSHVRVLRTAHNVGYAGGANAALRDWMGRAATPQFCVIGSHDLHVARASLERLLSWARAHPDFGVLGPILTAPRPSSGGEWTGIDAYELPPCRDLGLQERDWVSGTCLLLRLECVLAIGGFDALLGSYMEDVDFCLRARGSGWKVGVVGNSVAWGLGSATSDVSMAIEANTIIVAAKYGGLRNGAHAILRLAAWTVRAAVGSAIPSRAATRRRRSFQFFLRHLRVAHRVAVYATSTVIGRVASRVPGSRRELGADDQLFGRVSQRVWF
jgi:GT2 family glycosyltransferase